jgi:hypothetical protein
MNQRRMTIQFAAEAEWAWHERPVPTFARNSTSRTVGCITGYFAHELLAHYSTASQADSEAQKPFGDIND